MKALGILALALCGTASAQWTLQTSGTTASLRGIHAVGNGVAWASGSGGTVLRTIDMGETWTRCATPPGGETLDFRGVQAFDDKTAVVMSSGPGDKSRLYKTVDGCTTWKLLFTNPDQEGFWDALVLNRFDQDGYLLGDPVQGEFVLWETSDKGIHWERVRGTGLAAKAGESAFAASNSALIVDEATSIRFVTGGPLGGRVLVANDLDNPWHFRSHELPLAKGTESSGAFSGDYSPYDLNAKGGHDCCIDDDRWVVVGGDFTKPSRLAGTAAFTRDAGHHWQAAATPPHGYRSAVVYNEHAHCWVTVGPNGTDISFDDGRNWRPMHPSAADAADADRGWNALSLPFVVGEKGRIGILRAGAVAEAQAGK